MKASKKLIGASVALVAALAVSVGTTYAWFTTNNKVSVENIQATVTTGDSNLEVALIKKTSTGYTVGQFGYSLDLGTELSDMLTNTKFDALTDNGDLTPASTSEGAKWAGTTKNGLDLRNKKGQAAKLYDGETNKEGNYLAFDLRFRTPISEETASGIELKLSYDSSVQSQHGAAPAYAPLKAKDDSLNNDFGIADDQLIETNAKDAIRIAFHEVDATTHAVKDTSGAAGKVWTPYADSATYNSKNLAQYVEAMFTDGKDADWFANLYKAPTYNTFNAATSSDDLATSTTVVTMKDDETGKVYCTADLHVVIWLEGTDADCLNSIFSDIVTIKLGFEIVEQA